jgi:hypothetical protein
MFLVSYANLSGSIIGDPSSKPEKSEIVNYYTRFYNALGTNISKPGYEVFAKALTGFFNLKAANKIKNNLLTIIDFSLSSTVERMWTVDMSKMKVVNYSLVAHGRNSGDEFPREFSNKPSSYQSSLGFYLTDDIYYGRNGMSLYLDGVEPDVNDKARERAIVIHGADYVSRDFIKNAGRLGRSFGCPSIPMDNHEKIISELSGKSCIYIYYPDEKYLNTSGLLNMEKVPEGISCLLNETSSTLNINPGFTKDNGNN